MQDRPHIEPRHSHLEVPDSPTDEQGYRLQRYSNVNPHKIIQQLRIKPLHSTSLIQNKAFMPLVAMTSTFYHHHHKKKSPRTQSKTKTNSSMPLSAADSPHSALQICLERAIKKYRSHSPACMQQEFSRTREQNTLAQFFDSFMGLRVKKLSDRVQEIYSWSRTELHVIDMFT